MSGKRINPGPMLYAPEDVAETFVALVRHPTDEVAVGWPARAAQIAYGFAPGPTEHVMGYFVRRSLDRAEPEPRHEGALRRPVPQGTTASGGIRYAKGVPSAGRVNRAIGLAALAGAALLLGSRALARARG
jgi:hypothetical protein